jgi:hypothetical protein
LVVIPVQTGINFYQIVVDSRLRGNDTSGNVQGTNQNGVVLRWSGFQPRRNSKIASGSRSNAILLPFGYWAMPGLETLFTRPSIVFNFRNRLILIGDESVKSGCPSYKRKSGLPSRVNNRVAK